MFHMVGYDSCQKTLSRQWNQKALLVQIDPLLQRLHIPLILLSDLLKVFDNSPVS